MDVVPIKIVLLKGSLRLGRIAGIPIYLHWSFPLLLVYVAYNSYAAGNTWQSTMMMVALSLAIFLCVLLHELGHSLAARKYGIGTQDIILTPLGGVARLDRFPDKPRQEMFVAIAGPLVNVGIALLLSPSLWLAMDGWDLDMADALINFNNFLPILLFGNLMLVAFNLLPIFPMDGGRVLRAALSIPMGRPKATRIAALLGQLGGLAMAAFGFYNGQYTFAFIGLFLVVVASMENKQVQSEHHLKTSRVGDIAEEVGQISMTLSVREALLAMAHQKKRYALLEDSWGRTAGLVAQTQLQQVMKQDPERTLSTLEPIWQYRYCSADIPLMDLVHLAHSIQNYLFLIESAPGVPVKYVDGLLLQQHLSEKNPLVPGFIKKLLKKG